MINSAASVEQILDSRFQRYNIQHMKTLWFKNKRYGWGWTPANAQGWMVTFLYVLLTLAYPFGSKWGYFSFSMPLFIFLTAFFTALFIYVCYLKGEKPRWRWGDTDES